MENKKRDDTAILTARANKVTPSYVRMIVNGTRSKAGPKASKILETYNSIVTTKEQLSQLVMDKASEATTNNAI